MQAVFQPPEIEGSFLDTAKINVLHMVGEYSFRLAGRDLGEGPAMWGCKNVFERPASVFILT
jgi:hypothetical protein